MKFLILFLFISAAQAGVQFTDKMEQDFAAIMDAQEKALDALDAEQTNKILPFDFQMNEMVTDVGVTKTGLLGIAALRSYAGVEVKWKRQRPSLKSEEGEESNLLIEGEMEDKDLVALSESITKMVMSEGKVKNAVALKANLMRSLSTVNEQVKGIRTTSYKGWRAKAIRLDLSFGVNGEVWFFTRLGVQTRLRLEWALREAPLMAPLAPDNDQDSAFVLKVLAEIDEATQAATLTEFRPAKIFVGVGGSYRRGLFGIWRFSTGFMGWLAFEPVMSLGLAPGVETQLPEEIRSQDFYIGGLDDEGNEKSFWPWRRRKISRSSFQKGLQRSLNTAEAFAAHAIKSKSKNWRVTEIKTVNDITKTGLFGLADVTTRGVVEIDLKR